MYRGDFVRKRVLSFLLAASAAFCFICSSAPEAHAIVPLGLVQSALASYVTSTGYKMYNDQGTGQDILGALGDLYDTFASSPTGTALNILGLTALADAQDIYLDFTGNMIVSKAAANMFQSFSDWLQDEYSIPDNTDTPTTVVTPTVGSYSDGNGLYCLGISCLDLGPVYTVSGIRVYSSNHVIGSYAGSSDPIPLYFYSQVEGTYYLTLYNNTYYVLPAFNISNRTKVCVGYPSETNPSRITSVLIPDLYSSNPYPLGQVGGGYTINCPTSTSLPSQPVGQLEYIGGAVGLALSIAQSVVDRANDLTDDESLVIAVGAGVGATAEDITAIVAQGVKAQTLEPSVTVVADAVIDTPVQPYPDIDSLGLPQLGAALVNRFPFCIPWDFVDTVRLLSAEPQPINISVDLIPQRIKIAVGVTSDTSFHIDLSGEQYARIGVFCRWGSLITFCFGLFLLTKRLVWTA